jgi:iron complex transport system substrate-binding protein
MRPTLKLLRVALCAALAIGACGRGDKTPGADAGASGDFPMTLSVCGRKVTIDKEPQKILTIGSDPAAAVAAAGAGDRVVARSSEGGGPLGPYESVLGKAPQITTNDAPSLEAIIGRRPDIVVSYELSSTDLPAGLSAVDFDDTYRQIEQLGRLFGTSTAADAAVAKLRSRQAAVEKRFSGADKRTATVIYVSEGGLSAYANHSVDHTVIHTLGLSDVFGDVAKRNVDINVEELIERNPDVIIATYGGSGTQIKDGDDAIRALRKIPGVNRLKAVRDGSIIPIHFGYLVGGPLAVDGLEMIADRQMY